LPVFSLQLPAIARLVTGAWPLITTCDSSLHTARSPCGELVLWSEKTTVCRIFSCKRTRCRSCRFAPVEHRFRDQPLSRTLWVTPARSRSPGFPILRPAITRDQAGPFEPSEPPTFAVALRWATYDQLACGCQPTFALRATVGEPSRLAIQSSLIVRSASDGWWRIPGSNR
jgi:hypothetical protein